MLKQINPLIVLSLFLWLAVGYGVATASGISAIDWWTIDAGGGELSGGGYAVTGTIGQFDTATLTGGSYTVEGGFWNSDTAVPTAVQTLNSDAQNSPRVPTILIVLTLFAIGLTLFNIRASLTRNRATR